jgi:hypothetical protein
LNGLLAPAQKSTPLPIVLLGKVRVCTFSSLLVFEKREILAIT